MVNEKIDVFKVIRGGKPNITLDYYQRLLRHSQEVEQKEQTLIKLTGCDMDKLIELFAAGYTLTPPKVGKTLSKLSEKDLNSALYLLKNF